MQKELLIKLVEKVYSDRQLKPLLEELYGNIEDAANQIVRMSDEDAKEILGYNNSYLEASKIYLSEFYDLPALTQMLLNERISKRQGKRTYQIAKAIKNGILDIDCGPDIMMLLDGENPKKERAIYRLLEDKHLRMHKDCYDLVDALIDDGVHHKKNEKVKWATRAIPNLLDVDDCVSVVDKIVNAKFVYQSKILSNLTSNYCLMHHKYASLIFDLLLSRNKDTNNDIGITNLVANLASNEDILALPEAPLLLGSIIRCKDLGVATECNRAINILLQQEYAGEYGRFIYFIAGADNRYIAQAGVNVLETPNFIERSDAKLVIREVIKAKGVEQAKLGSELVPFLLDKKQITDLLPYISLITRQEKAKDAIELNNDIIEALDNLEKKDTTNDNLATPKEILDESGCYGLIKHLKADQTSGDITPKTLLKKL